MRTERLLFYVFKLYNCFEDIRFFPTNVELFYQLRQKMMLNFEGCTK